VIDQDLPPFVVERGPANLSRRSSSDSVVFFNFRGDRAIEITKAFIGDAKAGRSTATPAAVCSPG